MEIREVSQVLDIAKTKHEQLGDILVLTASANGSATCFDVRSAFDSEGEPAPAFVDIRISPKTARKLALEILNLLAGEEA